MPMASSGRAIVTVRDFNSASSLVLETPILGAEKLTGSRLCLGKQEDKNSRSYINRNKERNIFSIPYSLAKSVYFGHLSETITKFILIILLYAMF